MQSGVLTWGEVFALLGVLAAVAAIVVPVVVKIFIRISASEDKCADADAELHKRLDVLHERVNRVREDYVRRDDLEKHINRLEEGQARIERALTSQAQRIDDALRVAAATPGAPLDTRGGGRS